MRIRRSNVAVGAGLVFFAALAAASCGGTATDVGSEDAGVDDAQSADASLDGATSDANGGADGAGDGDGSACPPHRVTCSGTCTDTRFDPNACGSCGHHCEPDQVCSEGACASSCPPAEAACRDEDGGLHCTDALHDNASCGYCGNACAPGDVCSNGKCSLVCSGAETKCVAGDGTAFCADLQNDPQNCNACGAACPTTNTGTATCAAGKCGVTCNAGKLDCNRNPIDGCEVSPESDRTNCGGCGAICPVGALCYSGSCGCPSSLFGTLELCPNACADIERDPTNCGGCGTRCTPTGANQSAACVESACRYSNRAASTGLRMTGIGLDDTYLYFAAYGVGIQRVTKGSVGETPVTIIADTAVSGMATHAGMIFWSSMAGIFECPVTGCVGAPKMLYDGNGTGSQILVDDTDVYFTAGGPVLDECPQTGCNGAPVTLASDDVTTWALGPSSVFSISSHYSSDPDTLTSLSTTAPPSSGVVYATHSYPNGVAYHGGSVYFFTGGNLVHCDPASCVPSALAPQPINYNSSGISTYYGGPIVVDDTSVVWVADGIHELNLSTGVDTLIANIESHASTLTMDATNVYWAGSDGVYWAAR